MARKIICPDCERLLEEGINPPEFKICPTCIPNHYPAADPNAIIDPTGKTLESDIKKQTKPKKLKFKVTHEIFTQRYPDKPRPVTLIVFKIVDYYQKPVMEFGFDFEQVKEIYEYMKEIDEESENE